MRPHAGGETEKFARKLLTVYPFERCSCELGDYPWISAVNYPYLSTLLFLCFCSKVGFCINIYQHWLVGVGYPQRWRYAPPRPSGRILFCSTIYREGPSAPLLFVSLEDIWGVGYPQRWRYAPPRPSGRILFCSTIYREGPSAPLL